MQASDLVALDLKGNRCSQASDDRHPNGDCMPMCSLHAPDAMAVLHCHPVHATALACHDRGIPAFHYMVAVAGGDDIRCAPYATFGTAELSTHVVTALVQRPCLSAGPAWAGDAWL